MKKKSCLHDQINEKKNLFVCAVLWIYDIYVRKLQGWWESILYLRLKNMFLIVYTESKLPGFFCGSFIGDIFYLTYLRKLYTCQQPCVRRSWGREPGSSRVDFANRSQILFDTFIDIDCVIFFHYINNLWKHSINVLKLFSSSVVMNKIEISWNPVSICELEICDKMFTVWLKPREKVKRPRK